MSRKSSQEKKQLEYTKGHFTFGFHSSRMFPKTWKRKKTHANRKHRRKAQELLGELKPGMGEDDLTSDDLTAARFQKSITRKRLDKVGTVTLGEKVKRKLEKRAALVGRRVRIKQSCDIRARSALTALNRLQGEELVEVARRAESIYGGNAGELRRVMSSRDPVDRALEFLHRISLGSAHESNALERSPALQEGFSAWLKKAERAVIQRQRIQASRWPKRTGRKD